MSKSLRSLRRATLVAAAATLALGLAVPAWADPTHPTSPPTTVVTPTPLPVPGTPLSEVPCRPQVNPLRVPPRFHFPKHRPPIVNNSLPTAPTVDNSLPRGRLLRLIRRICGETPPVDEANAQIRTLLGLGAQVEVVRHPTRPWFALVNVATDLAFLLRPGADASPEWASATSAVVAGPGVTNSLVLNDRLTVRFSAPVATVTRVNDFFPAGLSTPRENTRTAGIGSGRACTANFAATVFDGRYKLPALNSGSLFDDANLGTAGCASLAELRRTPFDDAGAGDGLNRADWTNVGLGFSPAADVVSRAVVRISWADGSQSTHVVRADTVSI